MVFNRDWNYLLKQRVWILVCECIGIFSLLILNCSHISFFIGKPLARCRNIEIPRAIDNFRYFAQIGANHASDCNPSEAGGFNYTWRRPVGVVGLITPWNLPLYLLTWKVAPALMMGNSIVAKPR
mgnify:CR=1 FL=1